MIKKIFFIGDSQIAYMSGGVIHKGVPKALEMGNHYVKKDGIEIYFLWQHSRTAFKVDEEYLNLLFKNHIDLIDSGTVIVSQFGGMDAALGLYQKHNNITEVINRYTNSLMEFTKKYGCKLIFMAPEWMVEDDTAYIPWLKVTEKLKEISKQNLLPDPIEIMYNVIQRKYEVVDEWKHHTEEDCRKILDYSILKVRESYGA